MTIVLLNYYASSYCKNFKVIIPNMDSDFCCCSFGVQKCIEKQRHSSKEIQERVSESKGTTFFHCEKQTFIFVILVDHMTNLVIKHRTNEQV